MTWKWYTISVTLCFSRVNFTNFQHQWKCTKSTINCNSFSHQYDEKTHRKMLDTVLIVWLSKRKLWQVKRNGECVIYPIASKVSSQVVREEKAAAYKFGAFHCITLWIPVSEEMKPTTPAISENMMRKPVAIFPKGKYIGKILAGNDRLDAANIFHHIKSHHRDGFYMLWKHLLPWQDSALNDKNRRRERIDDITCCFGSLYGMIDSPARNYSNNEVKENIKDQKHKGCWFACPWSHGLTSLA